MTPSDGDLVRTAWRGDRAAFEELARRHRETAQRMAERLLGDRELAEDLTQEMLLRAYLRLGELRDPDRFGAWLLAIGRSVCANWRNTQAIRRACRGPRPRAAAPGVPAG